ALGGSLVLRKPDGLVLTPLGERIFDVAQQMERAASRVFEAAGDAQERVRLSMPSGFTALFSPHLERLRAATPPIALEILSGSRVVDLARGEADLAVRVGRIGNPELIARPLGRVGWSLYAASAYLQRKPVNADRATLDGHDVIAFDPALADTPNA